MSTLVTILYLTRVTGLCKMECAKERLSERGTYYESDKSSRFYQASCRFSIPYVR